MTDFNKDNLKKLKNKQIRLKWINEVEGFIDEKDSVGRIVVLSPQAFIFRIGDLNNIPDEFSDIPITYLQVKEITIP